jgi:hypothetical protein
VYVDPQSALKSLATKFKNVAIDIQGASDYVPKVNAKIRCIKERYQKYQKWPTLEPYTKHGERSCGLCSFKNKHGVIHSNQPNRDT